jgi:AcrR family transcriptional regulator
MTIAVQPSALHAVLERAYPGARAQLKRRILAGALACFNEQGIEATTIDLLKERCDASVGNLYHHFGSKEGLVAALFFCALDDQAALTEPRFAQAGTVREGVAALVSGYVDWVTAQPELARFMYQARASVAKGPNGAELQQRNRQRGKAIVAWFNQPDRLAMLREWPAELFPSLIIGQAENYCRAWLSGRVKASPQQYREMLSDAAWRSVVRPDAESAA